jgi:flagellar biosynthesis GTPase FlhF
VTSARRETVPLIVWTVVAPFTVMALGAGLQVDTPDPSGPTAIEQALIEHACPLNLTRAEETAEHQQCLSAQLQSLRADFGRDLTRLSGSERRTLDSACSKIREARGREAYLECLGAQLVALRNRRVRANPAPPEAAAAPSPPVVSVPSVSPPAPAPRATSWSSGLWIGATLLTLIVVAGAVVFALKTRRPPRRCRICGGDVAESGDLCQKCRHDAADAVRFAAAERADQQRTRQEEQRRLSEHEEEQRQRKARHEEEAPLREQEEARQREKEARQRDEERAASQLSLVAAASQEVFDPYVVLGVPRDASRDEIQAAYQGAKAKYDPDQVAHLSAEVQEHFEGKAQEVDRAHQKLTE